MEKSARLSIFPVLLVLLRALPRCRNVRGTSHLWVVATPELRVTAMLHVLLMVNADAE
jgi:hypothetical protein